VGGQLKNMEIVHGTITKGKKKRRSSERVRFERGGLQWCEKLKHKHNQKNTERRKRRNWKRGGVS